MFWPTPSSPEVFAARRRRLLDRYAGPVVLASGLARVRNMQSSFYPFRAESHFLYFTGAALEGAALLLEDGKATLFVTPPEAGASLWRGPEPSLDELALRLGLEVLPVEAFEPREHVATLKTQDVDSSEWLAELLDREVEQVLADELSENDTRLADAIIELRLRHDAGAIAQLKQAAQVTAAAHLAGMRKSGSSAREVEVMAAMQAEILASGMTCAYPPIVTIRGEVLHCERYDNELKAGDLLLADVGAETPEGWAGDVTRTWPVSGRFSASQRALYEAVLTAQLAAISEVKPGVRYRDVHKVAARSLVRSLVELSILRGDADDLFERGAAAIFFPHGVGHLLGLDVHDLDDLGDRATYAAGRKRSTLPGERYLRLDRDLEEDMVVTIEPGFYQVPSILEDRHSLGALAEAINFSELAKYADVRGIRIEDDVRVTASGHELLSGSIPKTVPELESFLAH